MDMDNGAPPAPAGAAGMKRPRPEDDDWDATALRVSSSGAVDSPAVAATVVRLVNTAQTATQRSTCINMLQATGDAGVLDALVRGEIFKAIKLQLRASAEARDVDALRGFLLVLLQLPADLGAIAASGVGSLIARLSGNVVDKDKSKSRDAALEAAANDDCRRLASSLYADWASKAASAKAAKPAKVAVAAAPPAVDAASSSKASKSNGGSERKKARREDAIGNGDKLGSSSSPMDVDTSALPALTSLSSNVGGSGDALPAMLPSMNGLGAADVIIDDGPVRRTSASADWGGGVMPAEDPAGEGISVAEMAGLVTARGDGVPDRYGAVTGGILKNKQRGVTGGRASHGGSRRIVWVDTLPAADAVHKHAAQLAARADAYQLSHLVAVKLFNKLLAPSVVSTGAGTSGEAAATEEDVTMGEDGDAAVPADATTAGEDVAEDDEETKHRRFREAEHRARAAEAGAAKIWRVDLKSLLNKIGVKGLPGAGGAASVPVQIHAGCAAYAAWAAPASATAAPLVQLHDPSHARPASESVEGPAQAAIIAASPAVAYAMRDLIPPSPAVSHAAFLHYAPGRVPPDIPKPAVFTDVAPAQPPPAAMMPPRAAAPPAPTFAFALHAPGMPPMGAAPVAAVAPPPAAPTSILSIMDKVKATLRASSAAAGATSFAQAGAAPSPPYGFAPPSTLVAPVGMQLYAAAASPYVAAAPPPVYAAGAPPYNPAAAAPYMPPATQRRPVGNSRFAPTRPCAWYNTPQGCKNGDSCAFIHDPSYVASSEVLAAISMAGKANRQQQQQGGGGYMSVAPPVGAYAAAAPQVFAAAAAAPAGYVAGVPPATAYYPPAQ